MKSNFNYIKVEYFFNKEDINNIYAKFNQIWRSSNRFQSIHQTVRVLEKKDIIEEPLFFSIMDKIQKKYELIVGESDLKFKKLWLVSSKPEDTNKFKLPYIPHIDKSRYLKAMVYLHEVSKDHGPIHIGKIKKNVDTEEIRKKLDGHWKAKGSNTILKELLEDNLAPMTGNAGDVIFFDTNTPHAAGIIRDGYSRKVLRFDFERPFFNQRPSKLNQFITRIYNKMIRETKNLIKFKNL